MTSELDLRGLLAHLHSHEVRFVVIGAVAVGAHGFIRGTDDLDIVPDPDHENLMRLSNALVRLDATLPLANGRAYTPARDEAQLRRGRTVTLETRLGALDVVQRVPGVPGYAQLRELAIETEMLGVPLLICSLSHLRAMKEARGSNLDRADLDRLPDE
ncbi:MAG: hypothetical protein ACRDK9_09890 [Solirubrobacterales bacterium]